MHPCTYGFVSVVLQFSFGRVRTPWLLTGFHELECVSKGPAVLSFGVIIISSNKHVKLPQDLFIEIPLPGLFSEFSSVAWVVLAP